MFFSVENTPVPGNTFFSLGIMSYDVVLALKQRHVSAGHQNILEIFETF